MLEKVPSFSGGVVELGKWGAITLTGAETALLRASYAMGIEFPAAVAARSLTSAGLILNDEEGVLLVLPYTGEAISRIVMTDVDDPLSVIELPRDEDTGMRVAGLRIVPHVGVVFLTECSLLLFGGDLRLMWQVDEDLGAWRLESVDDREIELFAIDGSGNELRQFRGLADGRRLDEHGSSA